MDRKAEPDEMGCKLEVLLLVDGEPHRFSIEVENADMETYPPSIHWKSKDGKNEIKTFLLGYLKGGLH